MGEVEFKIAPIFEKMHFEAKAFHATGAFQSQKGKGGLNFIFWLCIRIPIKEEKETFELTINERKTEWRRVFGGKRFITKTKMKGTSLIESKGIFEFEFSIKCKDRQLIYEFQRFKVLKIPMPKVLSIQPHAICEQVDDNKWVFNVETKSPFGQPIIRYWGVAETKFKNSYS